MAVLDPSKPAEEFVELQDCSSHPRQLESCRLSTEDPEYALQKAVMDALHSIARLGPGSQAQDARE